LLKHFGDVQAVAAAEINVLLEVNGITNEIAKNIQAFFHRES